MSGAKDAEGKVQKRLYVAMGPTLDGQTDNPNERDNLLFLGDDEEVKFLLMTMMR
jgi:hypothetical protein